MKHTGAVLNFQTSPLFMFNPTASSPVYVTETKRYVPCLKLRASSFVLYGSTDCHNLDDWGDIQTHPVSAVVIALTWFCPLHSSQSTWFPTCSLVGSHS